MDDGNWINALILTVTALICLYLGYRIGYVQRECELLDDSDESIYDLEDKK